MKKGDITTDTAGIHRILKYYYEPLIVNKLYNLGKTVTVLEKQPSKAESGRNRKSNKSIINRRLNQ